MNNMDGWGSASVRYGGTTSGWFGVLSFQYWFNTIFLPAAKKISETKVFIEDNLFSHFTELVLSDYKMYNLQF